MKLDTYLIENNIKRSAFAARIGVSPQSITGWCDYTFWPGRDNVTRILIETDGAVTPNDFLDFEHKEVRPYRAVLIDKS